LKDFIDQKVFTDKTENVVKNVQKLIDIERFVEEAIVEGEQPDLMVSK